MICVGTVCRCEGIRDLFALLQFKRDLVLPFVIPMKENNQTETFWRCDTHGFVVWFLVKLIEFHCF